MRRVFIPVIIVGFLAMLQMSCNNPIVDEGVKSSKPLPPLSIGVATIAADYSAANFEIISQEDGSVKQSLIPGLYTDLVVRAHGGYFYILERYGKDNVIKYGDGGIDYQQSLGTGLNVQDIAVVSNTKAYISCWEDAGLIVFDPTAGSKVSTIDLSRFNTYAGTDSAEAYPFASALAVNGDYLYVACQRLKTVPSDWGSSFEPADTSKIVVIDTRDNSIVTSINLHKKNPASMDVFQNTLLVASSGHWSDAATGGVEVIDLTSNTNQGVKVEGSAFGGSVSNVVFVSQDKAYVGKMGTDWSTEIIPFNPTSGTVGAKVAGISDGFGGLAYDGTNLYVGERGAAENGVLVINPSTNAVVRTIKTEMPPSSIAIIFAE